MANKRDFKKSVDAIGSAVCDEMMTAYYNIEGADKEAISKAIEKVLGACIKAKDNSNIFFDKGVKAFDSPEAYVKAKTAFFKALFNKVHTEFGEEINAALQEFNKAIPASVKEANKEAVAE
ncbi:MAG: hypothetical protein K2G53_09705 [Muribaculaceae bacterium]|nr:hypothetical protein [Bacteroidales bacterium]MDE6072806.1 hypothetical protein [Muribaculaceae bacterium]